MRVLFEKISVFYFDWPKSWICQTLRHVRDIFCKFYLHNTSKEVYWPKKNLNSMHGFKSAIVVIFQFWQNDTFEPVHGTQKFFGLKDFFWRVLKVTFKKNVPNMSQRLPNLGFRSVRLENWGFLKKDSQDFKSSFQSGFL